MVAAMPPPDRERRRAPGSGGTGKFAKKGAAPRKAAPATGSDRAPARTNIPKKWGGLARKGTRWLDEPGAGPATTAWREAVARSRGEVRPGSDDDGGQDEVRIERVQPKPRKAAGAEKRARSSGRGASREPEARTTRARPPRRLPGPVLGEISKDVAPARATKYAERLGEAARAYERDRYRDALKILRPLVEQVPGSPAVRELNGLTLYRLGRWRDAAKELEAFREMTSSYDQHPTLADCYRALKRWKHVDALWEELRVASPSAELVTEGRIVMAGALADRGRLSEAIELLDKARAPARNPRPHHLRLWYVLADLYERVGELPRARELFGRVAAVDPELYDAGERLSAID